MPLTEITIRRLTQLLASGAVTSRHVVRLYLDRISAFDEQLASVLTVHPEAESQAAELDRLLCLRGSAVGPLHGVPLLLKDNIDTADLPTTAGCVTLRGCVPAEDAPIVRRLRDAGAIILGKCNMGEFAVGDVSSLRGQVRNPYGLDYTPSGSSAGTAVAVAANLAVAGLGTDTGGSVRQPAAFNGLVGLRPTVGLLNTDGVVPVSSTMDVPGPLTRTVDDAAALLDVLSIDPDDKIGSRQPPRSLPLDARAVATARIGVVRGLEGDGRAASDAVVRSRMDQAATDLRTAGARLRTLDLGDLWDLARETERGLKALEFGRDINRYLTGRGDTVPHHTIRDIVAAGEFCQHPRVRERLLGALEVDTVGLEHDPAYRRLLEQRDAVRDLLYQAMDDHDVDVLLYPTFSTSPTRIGTPQPGTNAALSSVSGFPAISVPAGFTPQGLPVGLELLGRPYTEPMLLGLAAAYEARTRHRRPPPTAPALPGGDLTVAPS